LLTCDLGPTDDGGYVELECFETYETEIEFLKRLIVADRTGIGENAKIGCTATVDEGNKEGDGNESEDDGDDEPQSLYLSLLVEKIAKLLWKLKKGLRHHGKHGGHGCEGI
jgi:hypothetical protein